MITAENSTQQTLAQENVLTEHAISINGQSARYYRTISNTAHDTNDNAAKQTSKPVAHFYGGNGFAVGAYVPLLSELNAEFDMVSLAMRGTWHDKPTAKKLTREQDADILIKFIEQTQSSPIIGIGHSQGATATALACAKRPDLFSALYLIEPVTFTRKQRHLYNLLPTWLLKRYEPFKSTLTKQALWQSVDEYYQYLRQKNAFKRISDEHLHVYATNSLEQTKSGFSLVFLPEQELANYFGVPFIDDALMKINKQVLPYHLLIGKPSIFISNAVRENWKSFVPSTSITVYNDYGHLLPVEAPKLCAKKIIELAGTR